MLRANFFNPHPALPQRGGVWSGVYLLRHFLAFGFGELPAVSIL
jgi:hypothetical protein